jgi:hypothetical protein
LEVALSINISSLRDEEAAPEKLVRKQEVANRYTEKPKGK